MAVSEKLKLEKVKGKGAYRFLTFNNEEVFIGDPDEATFKPQLLLKRWQEECFIKLPIGITAKQLKLDQNVLSWEADFFSVKVYTVNKKQIQEGKRVLIQNEHGGVEFEVILKSKPPINILSFPIQTKDLKFYYQKPLTQQEITEGCVRPENVVGSYAVYHATRTNMHRNKEDAEKYKCGKAFHIYRPKATDNVGNEAWCDLSITDNVLTVTIPQEFLDLAVYPITIDPNFGYEDIGQSGESIEENGIRGSVFTIPANGVLSSITAFLEAPGGPSGNYKMACYKHSNLSLIGGSVSLPLSGFFEWQSASVSGTLVSGTAYVLLNWFDVNCGMEYDDGDADQGHRRTITYGDWLDPITLYHNDNKYSIYGTYSTAPEIVEKGFSDQGLGSDVFSKIVTFLKAQFGDVGLGVDTFEIPYKGLGFSDVGYGADVFGVAVYKYFVEVGEGTDAFVIPFKSMEFAENGDGTDVFDTFHKEMDFSDAGYGTDIFAKTVTFLNVSFSDAGYGTDAFALTYKTMNFSDVGNGSEIFSVFLNQLAFNVIGYGADSFSSCVVKTFMDVGSGTDSFEIPHKEMKFEEEGSGVDSFVMIVKLGFNDIAFGDDLFQKQIIGWIMKSFADSAHGSDVFVILLKGRFFAEAGIGIDSFVIPYKEMKFVEMGVGLDSYAFAFKTTEFSDSGLGSDAFRRDGEFFFSDVGYGTDVFSRATVFVSVKFSDVGHGIEAFNVPYKEMKFQDLGKGLDFVFLFRPQRFFDVGHGLDIFIEESRILIVKRITLVGGNLALKLYGSTGKVELN